MATTIGGGQLKANQQRNHSNSNNILTFSCRAAAVKEGRVGNFFRSPNKTPQEKEHFQILHWGKAIFFCVCTC